jgi:acyl dehydratase
VSSAAVAFDLAHVGRWSEPEIYAVTREATIAYARATNDDIPQHTAGELAPPLFAVVPVASLMAPLLTAVIPSELTRRVVIAGQDLRFAQAIVPDMTLTSRGSVVGVHSRPSGVAVVVKLRSFSGEDLVCEQVKTIFVRGADAGDGVGESPPSHAVAEPLREPLAAVVQRLDEDQTVRYADASGDRMPIHLDDAVARQVGLPGIIVHGLCTMAIASHALIRTACPEDPERLRRLAVRFAAPVRPGQTITTRIEPAGVDLYAFETAGAERGLVLKDGWAEVA